MPPRKHERIKVVAAFSVLFGMAMLSIGIIVGTHLTASPYFWLGALGSYLGSSIGTWLLLRRWGML